MAARSFETLVNDFIGEYGIGGGGPLETVSGQSEAVVGQSGDLGRAVRMIRDAWDHIATLWTNWDFLWFSHSVASTDTPAGIPASAVNPTMPSFTVRRWNRARFVIGRGTSGYVELEHVPYKDFFRSYYLGAAGSGVPRYITTQPDGTLVFNSAPATAQSFYGEGWKLPTRLAADADVPEIPENFDRMIILQGAIMYADKVDAPEWLEGAQAEYLSLLSSLQSSYLEGFDYDTMSTPDEDLYREVPGQVSTLRTTR